MIFRILVPAALGIAMALPAVAAPSTTSPSATSPSAAGTTSSSATVPDTNGNSQSSMQQDTPKIAAKLRQSLAQAGFTDVHVMPRSFLVRAKDSDGHPVMMLVNPESVTAVTAMGASRNGTTSSGNGQNGSSNGANATTKE